MYTCNITLPSATVQYQLGTENVWRLTSLFDPDQTGGTHQPYGFDQMAALYARYLVRRCEISITAQNAGLPNSLCVGIQPNDNTSSISNLAMSDAVERSFVTCKHFNTLGMVTQDITIDMAQLAGMTPQQWEATEDYQALVTASPSKNNYLRIALSNNKDTSTSAAYCTVTIAFVVDFFQRITYSASN